MIEDMSKVTNTKIYFVSYMEELKFEADEEEVIYRIIQESTTNAIRHGKATEIWIRLIEIEEELTIIISDNGCGCEDIKEGFGLKHIRERGFQLRRSQCDTAVMPQKDIFAGRRRGVPARIVHVIQADAAFEREIPPPKQHPRVARAGTYADSPAVVAFVPVPDAILCEGGVHAPKEADVRLEAPAAHTHDGSQHFGSQTFGRDRVPVCRRFDRPFFRYGHIHTGIDGSRCQSQRIDAHGRILSRSCVRREDEQQQYK